jgi:hypothetical protein
MVGIAGIGIGVNTGGACIHQAWQSLPTVPIAPFFAKPALRKRPPVPGMRVTMMLPKFSPAKILENIIFSLRFKTPEDKTEASVQSSVENGNGVAGNVLYIRFSEFAVEGRLFSHLSQLML